MQRLIRNNFFWVVSCIATIKLLLRRTVQLSVQHSALASQFTLSLSKGRTLVLQHSFRQLLQQPALSEAKGSARYSAFISREDAKILKHKTQRVTITTILCAFAIRKAIGTSRLCVRSLVFLCVLVSPWFNSCAQRIDINLNNDWQTSLAGTNDPIAIGWKKVNVPHNWDDYYAYRRLLHGNLHGDAVYKKTFVINQSKTGKRFFLYFEGVGSYATVILNKKKVGSHAGGRTTFTLDVTGAIKTDGTKNEVEVLASHPASIKDLPWVCGGCSEERGFSEGSQPLGIFRPVHLIITNDVRIEPFGVHAWAKIDSNYKEANLYISTTFKNYSDKKKLVRIVHQIDDSKGKFLTRTGEMYEVNPHDSVSFVSDQIGVEQPLLWSVESPNLYTIKSFIIENNKKVDSLATSFGFRTINWRTASNQFLLNGKPVFINGIAEYEHLLGQSHAFSHEQINARMKWVKAAGFNAFRDGHQPHNLLYGKLCNEKGILWWTQMSAHVWYDTKEFRSNFKQLIKEWVIERRNDPSVILWGLQNESKLPDDFGKECTELIRSLDPTASTQRLVTTCNGGAGTDWDVPQNWTGTYGGDPKTYGEDLKKQVLVGEYGAWRTIDLHTEGGFVQNGVVSEDRMTQLMEQKVRLAESVKDSVAGHFFWLLTSHDNPGRVQGGEGLRELDRIGPVNYKGLLTPWEEPTDAFYMFRSNYASKEKEPMVYIVSHTWPNRWMKPGIKDSIYVYSNCDEVELFNDIDNVSLGKRKRNSIGTHFQWDHVNVQYNVFYAVGYINGKLAARDTIVLNHLPQSPNYSKLFAGAKNIAKPQPGYNYIYRINCGGPDYRDENGNRWNADKNHSASWTDDFPDLPKYFASQRRTFSPVKGTKDWKLFQTFRYGKDKLKYEFQLPDGEYLLELYFIEPWLGIGGGINARGMRLFDVAINGKTVLNDLDTWAEAGTNTALKKIVKATVTGGKMVISFPETKAGEALICAIAVAAKENKQKEITDKSDHNFFQTWLDLGDKQYRNENISFNSLPSFLYGVDWIQYSNRDGKGPNTIKFDTDTYFYVAVKMDTSPVTGFENVNAEIVTDENGGTVYKVYREFYPKDSIAFPPNGPGVIMAFHPANKMQPAYDLKPIIQYRTNVAKLNNGVAKDSVNGRFCAVVNTNNEVTIDYPIQTGVADIYSITMKYFYNKQSLVKGRIQLIGSGNTMMLDESVQFNFTSPGKWNQFTINTVNMINAGNYVVRLVIKGAEELAISSVDIQ